MAAKELDDAIAKAEAEAAKTKAQMTEAKDGDARKSASEAHRAAQVAVEQLRGARNQVEHPHVGPAIPPLPREELSFQANLEKPNTLIAAQLKLEKGIGLVVTSLEKEGAAAKAGIQVNDILVQVDGRSVDSDMTALRKMLSEIKPNTAVTAIVIRQGKQESIRELQLPPMPTDSSRFGRSNFIGRKR